MLKTTVAFLLTTLSSGATLKDIIREDPRLSEFHYTLSETNVDLSGDGPFTVFAPINGAFVNSGGLSTSKFKNVQNDETKLQKLINGTVLPFQIFHHTCRSTTCCRAIPRNRWPSEDGKN